MWLFPLDAVPWDPMYITQTLLSRVFGSGFDDVWNNFLWFAIGAALLGYAVVALARKEVLPFLSQRKLKRLEWPIAALIIGMTFLIQAGQPDLLSAILAKFGVDF